MGEKHVDFDPVAGLLSFVAGVKAEKIDDPGSGIFEDEVGIFLADDLQFFAHHFGELDGQIGFFVEQHFEVFQWKGADGHFFRHGLGKFVGLVVGWIEGDLTKNIALLQNFGYDFLVLVVVTGNFDPSFFEDVQPVDLLVSEIDVVAFGGLFVGGNDAEILYLFGVQFAEQFVIAEMPELRTDCFQWL